jgi:hypothetical protein
MSRPVSIAVQLAQGTKESIFNINNLNNALANRMLFFDLSTWNPAYFMGFAT